MHDSALRAYESGNYILHDRGGLNLTFEVSPSKINERLSKKVQLLSMMKPERLIFIFSRVQCLYA